MNDDAEEQFRSEYADALKEVKESISNDLKNGIVPPELLSHIEIDGITLGLGKSFPIRPRHGLAVKVPCGSVCPKSKPCLPQEYLPDVERTFKALGLLADGFSLHWVGDQSDVSSLCTCFRPGGPGVMQPGCKVAEAEDSSALSKSSDEQWLTVRDAAVISGANSGVISRAVAIGQLLSNGKKGRDRRIDGRDLNRWVLARSKRPEAIESDAVVARKLRSD